MSRNLRALAISTLPGPRNACVNPCSGDTCPPGYGCYEGVCRPSSRVETKVEKAKNFAIDELKGAAFDAARDAAIRLLRS